MYNYPPTLSDVFDQDTCQKIEDKSRAVIIRDGDCRLIIQGSDQLHVLLALSIVEDIAARFVTNVSESSANSSSVMLDKVLNRAYSNDGEVEDVFDWSTMPEEVKRAVLVSLLDSDVPETTVADVKKVADERLGNEETVQVDILPAGVGSFASGYSAATTASVSDTSSVTAANRVVDLPLRLDFSDPTIQPLVKLALSKDYSREEIKDVLSKNSQWKESEFLRALHTSRRIRTAISQQAPVSVTKTQQQQPVVLCGSAVTVHSVFDDKNAHSCTLSQSAVSSAAGPKDVRLHRVGTGGMEVANAKDVDTYMDVDEITTEVSAADDSVILLTAADDSVILLKSDQEMESSDDADVERAEIEKDNSALVLSTEQSLFPEKSLLPTEQVQKNAAAESGAVSRHRQKKKKRNKRKVLQETTAHQKDKALTVVKTGDHINDLDCISLVPSASPAIVDVSSDVIIDDSSDSDIIEVPANAGSMKPVLSRNARRQLAHQNEARSRSPLVRPSGTNDRACENESYGDPTPRRLDYPATVVSSVPGIDSGNLNVMLILLPLCQLCTVFSKLAFLL